MAAKLNRYGQVLSLCFLLAGLAFAFGLLSDVSLGDRLYGLVWVGVAGFTLHYSRRSNAKAAIAAEIADGGTRGVATVVSIDTGFGSMGVELLLRLRLELPGAAPREIDLAEEVTEYAGDGIKQGMRLPVIVDSADPNRVVLVW